MMDNKKKSKKIEQNNSDKPLLDITDNAVKRMIKSAKSVGYVTSGGYAHYVQKSIALGYLPVELTKKDTKLEIEINGQFYSAKVITEPLYDPRGLKMRS